MTMVSRQVEDDSRVDSLVLIVLSICLSGCVHHTDRIRASRFSRDQRRPCVSRDTHSQVCPKWRPLRIILDSRYFNQNGDNLIYIVLILTRFMSHTTETYRLHGCVTSSTRKFWRLSLIGVLFLAFYIIKSDFG